MIDSLRSVDGGSLPIIKGEWLLARPPLEVIADLLRLEHKGRLLAWGVEREMNLLVQRLAPDAWRTLQNGMEYLYWCNDCRVLGFQVIGAKGARWTISEYIANEYFPRGVEKLGSATIHDLWGWIQREPEEGQDARKLYLALKRIAKRLGIQPTGWHSPSYFATSMMRKAGVLDAMPDDLWYYWNSPIEEKAFYGGRIETRVFGHSNKRVRIYDIRSAYPWALTQLPNLRGAELEEAGWEPPGEEGEWSLHHVRWGISTDRIKWPMGPFPVRDPRYPARKPRLIYPRIGEGVYWSPLVREALKHYGDRIMILGTYRVVGKRLDERPFRDCVEPMYAARKSCGRELDERLLKVAMQAIWGKLCQRAGGLRVNEYECIGWAGMVTALVHARLLQAAMSNPGFVWAFTGDGIITVGGGLNVPAGEGLGEWEVKEYSHIEAYRDGLYRVRRDDGEWVRKSCGFYKGSFPWEEAAEKWRSEGPFNSAVSSHRLFVGYRQASSDEDWCTVKEIEQVVPFHPENRGALRRQRWEDDNWGHSLRWLGYQPTLEEIRESESERQSLAEWAEELFFHEGRSPTRAELARWEPKCLLLEGVGQERF